MGERAKTQRLPLDLRSRSGLTRRSRAHPLRRELPSLAGRDNRNLQQDRLLLLIDLKARETRNALVRVRVRRYRAVDSAYVPA